MTITKIPSKMITLPLSSIDMQRGVYLNVPPYQREAGIWTKTDKKSLIYTTLRQLPVPAIITYREGTKFFVLDGLQRMTVLLDFLHDGFTTFNEKEFRKWVSVSSTLEPLEPGKKFSQMSPEYQEAFSFCDIIIIQIDRLSPEEQALYFVNLQRGKKLSIGEKYQAYDSETSQFAAQMKHHEYFDMMYLGGKNRNQKLQMCLFILEMELTHLYTDLREEYLLPLVTGKYDNKLTAEKRRQVMETLDGLCYLFSGALSYSLTDIVPLYQATCKLRDRGYTVFDAKRGCLRPWIEQVRATAVKETWGHSTTF